MKAILKNYWQQLPDFALRGNWAVRVQKQGQI